MSFTIFQNEKSPFYAIKPRSSNTRIIDIFPKGLTHGFGPKMVIFRTFFFGQFRPGKYLLRYSRTKEKKPFYTVKSKRSESRKIDVFPKGLTHGFGPKMIIFPSFFFKAIQTRKMSFSIVQIEKTPVYAIKTKSPKKRKIGIFPKGLTHGFGPEMAIFRTFLFWQFRQGKCLLRYFRTKKRLSTL